MTTPSSNNNGSNDEVVRGDEVVRNDQVTNNPTNNGSTNNSIVLDQATLERIIAAAVTSAVQVERGILTEANKRAPQIAVVEKALSWTDFPKWPGKCDRVDAWFQSLEAKLK